MVDWNELQQLRFRREQLLGDMPAHNRKWHRGTRLSSTLTCSN